MSNCVIVDDGTVHCKGENNWGQLGSNRPLRYVANDFEQVTGISDAVSLVGSNAGTCAVLASGSVKCWGFNGGGQIGDGTKTNRFVPQQVFGLNRGIFRTSLGEKSLSLQWIGSLGPRGLIVSDYEFRLKKEQDSEWANIQDPVSPLRSLSLGALDPATSYQLSIQPIVANQSIPPTIYSFGTKGTASIQFSIRDSNGDYVQFGKYSWKAVDGSAKSSSSREASALGQVTFGSVPAKEITLFLSGGVLPNGSRVSGSFDLIASKGAISLRLPEVASPVSKQVKVQLEGGDPVPAAKVFSMNLEKTLDVSGGNFEGEITSFGSIESFTNSEGLATVAGFADDEVLVQAVYDDGQLEQTTDFTSVLDSLTIISLGYLPILRLDAEELQANFNSMVEIPVQVSELGSQAANFGAAAYKGVKVRIVAPSGSNQNSCGKKPLLSTSTDSLGRAKLKICANVSGDYKLVTSGAVSAGSVSILVRNSKPNRVESLEVLSEAPGTATLAWEAPLFDGGSQITSFKIVAKSSTLTRTYSIKIGSNEFVSRSILLTALTGNRNWVFTVYAGNKFGSSPGQSFTRLILN
jgi:hypothetical protein